MKKTKLYAWGAGLLASIVLVLAVSGGCSKAEAAPLSPVAMDAAWETANPAAAILAQVVDNKAPWPNTVAPAQFGNWYDFNDVYDYVAGTNWTVTLVEGGSGEADPALSGTTSVKGGSLNLTGDTNDNDGSELDQVGEPFQLDAGDTLVFCANITTGTDVTQVDLGFGIGITDTDWLGDTAIMSDGIWFEKNDGDTNLDLVCAKDAAATSDYTRQAAVSTLAASTTYKLCFIVQVNSSDATKARVRAFVNNAQVYSGVITTDIPDDEGMCIKFGLQQGEATNLKTVKVNSIGCAQGY